MINKVCFGRHKRALEDAIPSERAFAVLRRLQWVKIVKYHGQIIRGIRGKDAIK